MGGDAAHPVRRQKKEPRALRLRRAREPHPRGVGDEAAAARREPHVRNDQPEAGRKKHLRRCQRFFDAPRAHPEQTRQIYARLLCRLRVEVISQVDQRRVLSAQRRASERRKRDREAAARSVAHDLDEVPIREFSQKRLELGSAFADLLSGARKEIAPADREIRRAQELRARAGQKNCARLFRKPLPLQKLLERESLRSTHDEPTSFSRRCGSRNLGVNKA